MIVNTLKNDLLIRALRLQEVERPPIWLMRQAGRYLPEYRTSRQKSPDFMAMCKNPVLACEVTLQPIDRFLLDAAIIFSDILTIPEAMGMELKFYEGRGPVFSEPLRDAKAIHSLRIPDVADDLAYVMEAIMLTKKELNHRIPLIGFSGSPWTLATYMIEGSGSKNFSLIKKMMYADPRLLKKMLESLSQVIAHYLAEQARAGADVLMIFDSWGGVLSYQAYLEFSLYFMEQIITQVRAISVKPEIPIILFTKGGGLSLTAQSLVGAQALGVDWTMPLSEARKKLNGKVALQGNLDPCALFAAPDQIRAQVLEMIQSYGPQPGLIVNCGHGLIPELDPEHVKIMVDTVRAFRYS